MSTLSIDQIQKLWVDNGGPPQLAPIMAAIAIAESGGNTESHNGNAATGDDSYGLWQINYFQNLRPSRVARYGEPAALVADPNLQAKAAIDLAGPNGEGLGNWSTYKSGAYRPFVRPMTQGSEAMAASPNPIIAAFAMGDGYVLVAQDGSVYCFNCQYHGRLEWNGTAWVVPNG
jgi:hypothetical protein